MDINSFALIGALALAEGCSVQSPPHTAALIELYTSQGCSSCPPADRWLSALPRDFAADRLVPLALHVGYWDYIGWKDPFARREFNARQRRLADLNRNRTVYTPGVFVQGAEMPGWSDRQSFAAAVRAINQQPARATITLDASVRDGAVAWQVRAASKEPGAEPRLTVALVQGGLVTAVKAGENRGTVLANDFVVRDWAGGLPLAQQQAFALPAGVAPQALSLVAFVQDDKRGAVLQAVQLPLAACVR